MRSRSRFASASSGSPPAGSSSAVPGASASAPPGTGPDRKSRRRKLTAPSYGCRGASGLARLGDLDEVAAGVVEHGRGDGPHLQRLLGEAHAETAKSLDLRVDV